MPALVLEDALWRDCPFCGGAVALIPVDDTHTDVAHATPLCTWFVEYLNSDEDTEN